MRDSTELDLVAVFDKLGTLCSFNSRQADGKDFPQAGVDAVFRMTLANEPIISTCLRGTTLKPALQFQLKCDFTPALIDSVGLSVAYSVPVVDPDALEDGKPQRLGLISVRMWFERLLELLPESDPNTQVVYVSDTGKVFEESINPRGGPFQIPPEKVREMLALLDSNGESRSLFLWKNLAIDLTLVPDNRTIENGSLYVLAYANSSWVTQYARQSRATMALAGGGVSLLVLAILSLLWVLQQRRMSQELGVARAASDAASHAKSDFLAAMSHEIRTPMNGVIGMVDVLMQSSLRPNQMDLARAIRLSADSLLTIVGDILDFSKIEAGKLEIEPTILSVEQVTEGSCMLVNSMAAKRNVQLTHYIDPSIPATVEGDPDRFRQIIVNLLSNAIKFSNGNGRTGRISVRATRVDEDDARVWVEVVVTDNGIGMDQAVLDRLFRPFEQGTAGTTRVHGGTGLGLVISQRLANILGGEISVTSTPGEGSAFSLRMPFTRIAQLAPRPSAVAGLATQVIGRRVERVNDLVSYLTSGGAHVTVVPELRSVGEADAHIWVVDPLAEQSVAQIRGAIREFRATHPGFDRPVIVVTSWTQRLPPYRTPELVQLDGAMVTRTALFHEIAVVTGRESPELDEASTGAEPSGEPSTARARAVHWERILVAEDNEINQGVIRTQLAVLGYPNDIAPDGVKALEAWRTGSYSIVLSDLHLPHMDGYQLAAAIRADEARLGRPRIPILALTADAIRGTDVKCRAAGMDDYLTKPLLLSALREALDKWAAKECPVRVDALTEQVGNDQALIERLLADFCTHLPGLVGEIERALLDGEARQAMNDAHKLKSSSRAVGADRLAEECETIERSTRRGDLAPARESIAALKQEAINVERFLAGRLGPVSSA